MIEIFAMALFALGLSIMAFVDAFWGEQIRRGRWSILRYIRKPARSPTWTYLKRDKRAWVGIALIIVIIGMAIFASFIAPYGINDSVRPGLTPPSRQFLFGTDGQGRDVFSRVIYGSRDSLEVALLLLVVETSIGIILGLVAGFYGGWVDELVMRAVDIALSFPGLVLAVAFVGFFGPGLRNLVIALSLTGWAPFARITRAQTLMVKEEVYIESARAIGEKDRTVIFRYILPNSMSPLIVMATMTIPAAILLTASMSFLGLGVQPPSPAWGMMLNEAMPFFRAAWWTAVFPGIAIMISVLGFNFLGDALRDALDPRLRAYRVEG
jgi:peptide/nickel transport system permease protein